MNLNWNTIVWLAWRQIRDNWLAYIYSPLYFAFMGIVLAADYSWGVEYALPVLMFIVIQPALSHRYFTMKENNVVTQQQAFLRAVPIEYQTIMWARVLAMLLAGVANVPLLFLPFWFLTQDFESFRIFVAWTAFWTGLGLIGSGLALMQEFWIDFRAWIKLNFVGVLLVFAVLILAGWLLDFRPYRLSVSGAHDHPWLMAAIGLALGIGSLYASVQSSVKGFRRREILV